MSADPKTKPAEPEVEDYDGYEQDDGGEYDPMDDCALGPDGQCGHAGSEFCDFECPMRNSEFFAGSEAWNKKHRRKK